MPLDQYVSVDGLRLHYREWSPNSRRVLILLHGAAVNCRNWDAIGDEMADEFRVLAIDLPGHGESDWVPNYSPSIWANSLDAITDVLAVDQFALVGHSMGGEIAWVFAGRRPEKVLRLVIVDKGPGAAAWDTSARFQNDAAAIFNSPDEAIAAARRGPFETEEALSRRIVTNLRLGVEGQWVWCHDGAGLARSEVQEPEQTQWARLAALRVQTLIVRGESSGFLSLETAKRMANVIPESSVAQVAGAGHLVHTDNSAGFVETVRPFLLL